MNEWIASSLITIVLIFFFALVIFAKEKAPRILGKIAVGLLFITFFILLVMLVHLILYDLPPYLTRGVW